ncbi:MAG: tetratricopeptide repeat protein [Planctomycetales bacterium]|nr:tetratricopeptide repeat protein [Planctomycetales bacterium]
MCIHAPRTVAVAILALTGCGSFDLRHGGTIAHKPLGTSNDVTQNSALGTGAKSNGSAQAKSPVKLDGASAEWKQAYVTEQLQQGGLHEQKGRTREARACYERALQKDPGNVTAHHRLAIACDLESQYIEAEQHYLAALEAGLANSDVLSDLGYSYLLQRRYFESEQALQEALQYNANHQFALGHLGTLYGLQGDFQRSREYLTRAGGEVKAQQELARLFPQGPTANPAIAAQGTANPPTSGQNLAANGVRTPPTTDTAPLPAAQYPNEATRKLAEQIAIERQKLAQLNTGKSDRSATGSPSVGTTNLPPDRRNAEASGANAGALAEQRRQRALDYLRNGPSPSNDLNRKFAELDSERPPRSIGSLNSGPGGPSAGVTQFDVNQSVGRTAPIAQASGSQPSGQVGLPMERGVTQIPTQPSSGNVSPIPTQIADTLGNPFARQNDSQSIEQARAIAAQMGLGAGTGSLPPVTAPDPSSRSRPAIGPAPSANPVATAPQANGILLQPPANSPTVQQALAKPPIQQPPQWSPQPPRQLPPGGNFAPLPQSQANTAPPTGAQTAVPQLLPNASGPSNTKLLPNADLPTHANFIPNTNVAPGNTPHATDPTQASPDLINQFQQQQQTILKYQQELDRLRQQGSTYQMYQYSTGQPSTQNVPR